MNSWQPNHPQSWSLFIATSASSPRPGFPYSAAQGTPRSQVGSTQLSEPNMAMFKILQKKMCLNEKNCVLMGKTPQKIGNCRHLWLHWLYSIQTDGSELLRNCARFLDLQTDRAGREDGSSSPLCFLGTDSLWSTSTISYPFAKIPSIRMITEWPIKSIVRAHVDHICHNPHWIVWRISCEQSAQAFLKDEKDTLWTAWMIPAQVHPCCRGSFCALWANRNKPIAGGSWLQNIAKETPKGNLAKELNLFAHFVYVI